jgi:hypothetical protein
MRGRSAIHVSRESGALTSTDYIEFWGEGLDTASTDTQIYWLVNGIQPGKRIVTVGDLRVDAEPSGQSIPTLPKQPITSVPKHLVCVDTRRTLGKPYEPERQRASAHQRRRPETDRQRSFAERLSNKLSDRERPACANTKREEFSRADDHEKRRYHPMLTVATGRWRSQATTRARP